jgi:hypothetical protein
MKDLATNQTRPYVQGDFVLDARLALVGSGLVWLERDGIFTQLRMEASPRDTHPDEHPSVEVRTPAGHAVVRVRPQGHSEASVAGFLFECSPTGKPWVRVEGSVETETWLSRVGLQDGDLILAINGQTLKNPQQTLQVLRKASHHPTLTVSLQRAERIHTIHVSRGL